MYHVASVSLVFDPIPVVMLYVVKGSWADCADIPVSSTFDFYGVAAVDSYFMNHRGETSLKKLKKNFKF